MSRTDKDRPYWVRCLDPSEDREWHPGRFRPRWKKIPADDEYRAWYLDYWGRDFTKKSRWTRDGWIFEEGQWHLKFYRSTHWDDWCIDSRTRWKFGNDVPAPRTGRSVARQAVRQAVRYGHDPGDPHSLDEAMEEPWSVWLEFDSRYVDKGYWSYVDPRDDDLYWRIIENLDSEEWFW